MRMDPRGVLCEAGNTDFYPSTACVFSELTLEINPINFQRHYITEKDYQAMLTKEKMVGILKKMMKLKKGKQFFCKIVKE